MTLDESYVTPSRAAFFVMSSCRAEGGRQDLLSRHFHALVVSVHLQGWLGFRVPHRAHRLVFAHQLDQLLERHVHVDPVDGRALDERCRERLG